ADERGRVKLFHQALEIAYQRGVTGAHSFDGWDGYQFMRSLAERRRLGLRVRYNVLAEDLTRALSELGERKLFGYGDDWLKITGVKVFADGALGSQTALMYRPFTGTNGNCGIAVTSPAELMKITRRAKRHGLPLAVHAIGDRAVTEVVTTLADNPPPAGTRHRVEHLQITRKKDLPLVVRSGVVCSMQPSHLPSDIPIMQRYLGLRINNCYLFGSLLKRGVPLAFGSDVPIEPLNPLGGIVDAVRRVSHSGGAAVNPKERISALAAARAFSHGAAFAVAEEHAFGSLLPGYCADLTILSHDLRRVNLRSVGDVSVVATVIDGKCVYSAGALAF
ncbi:MAG TPA: amidohydrolase family protein, partial [candidate division Zixibacteria bacterium]|nr:amidohydrolase family protein [candidate division Zixibacteria bacterium]